MRFQEEGGAEEAASGLNATAEEGKKPELCGGECVVRVVEGEEEQQYWTRVTESRSRKFSSKRGGRGEAEGMRARHVIYHMVYLHAGGGRGYKRHQGLSKEAPAAKQARPEQ